MSETRAGVGWTVIASACLALALSPLPAVAAGLDLRRVDSGLPAAGQWRNGFDLADLDGDGRLDLVHGPPRKGDGVPRVFRGLGGLKFALWSAARFPDAKLDYGDAAAADFDGDGSIDLALGVHMRGLTVLSGDGAGGFAPASSDSNETDAGPESRSAPGLVLAEPGSGALSSRALDAVDWNGDGRTDLVVLAEGAGAGPEGPRGFAVFLNLGSGAWRRVDGPEDRGFGDSLAVLDVDGDGRIDAVVAPRRLGDRTLIRRQTADGSWTLEAIDAARGDSYFPAVTVLDRGTGDAELAIALSFVERQGEDWRSGVDVLRKTATGWKSVEVASRRDALEIRALAAGDLDGDGHTDLVTGDQNGEVRVYLGKPLSGRATAGRTAAFKRLRSKPLERAGDGCSAYGAKMADLDGDGRDELVLSFAGEPKPDACPTSGSLQVWTTSTD